ncbi:MULTISPECIES: antibiotic biosynthesis monooxygenase family protein [Kordiimonas]|jgi:heme-degrading monooxygenase HmoA|uniref:antibiotic biosynthesis monooxygenase family protein n=1 Tax=Kordiimonas TaxID=288021 RepID=UPI00257BF6C9|nr:antibiotic biosynthesis monooxygenase [Kordiimonas sp. UBA4487]
MILEHAILNVKAGEEAAFEAAMADAKAIIAGMKGFKGLEVRPCLERTGQYLLLVRWETLEDHTEGFRGSPEYQAWKQHLHHFYEPFPTVEHYAAPVITA